MMGSFLYTLERASFLFFSPCCHLSFLFINALQLAKRFDFLRCYLHTIFIINRCQIPYNLLFLLFLVHRKANRSHPLILSITIRLAFPIINFIQSFKKGLSSFEGRSSSTESALFKIAKLLDDYPFSLGSFLQTFEGLSMTFFFPSLRISHFYLFSLLLPHSLLPQSLFPLPYCYYLFLSSQCNDFYHNQRTYTTYKQWVSRAIPLKQLSPLNFPFSNQIYLKSLF